MIAVGPTFFSSPSGGGGGGDHTPGDGLTLFQTTFDGGSSADVSSYAIGSGTIIDPAGQLTLTSGNLQARLAVAQEAHITWTNSSFAITGADLWTAEVFFDVTLYNPNFVLARTTGLNYFMDIWSGSFNRSWATDGSSAGGPNLPVATQSGFGNVYGSDLAPTNPSSVHHLAIIKRPFVGSYNLMDVYHNGVRIGQNLNWGASGSNGTIKLGGYGAVYSQAWSYGFKGVRVRRAEMYDIGNTGSFTPPASPFDWGAP